jgi:hypothetical protein
VTAPGNGGGSSSVKPFIPHPVSKIAKAIPIVRTIRVCCVLVLHASVCQRRHLIVGWRYMNRWAGGCCAAWRTPTTSQTESDGPKIVVVAGMRGTKNRVPCRSERRPGVATQNNTDASIHGRVGPPTPAPLIRGATTWPAGKRTGWPAGERQKTFLEGSLSSVVRVSRSEPIARIASPSKRYRCRWIVQCSCGIASPMGTALQVANEPRRRIHSGCR